MRRREREKEREITHVQYKTRGVPCRRTPPFFLKRGLPDHNGGLEEEEKTGQPFDHVAAANQPSRLHHEADSKAGI